MSPIFPPPKVRNPQTQAKIRHDVIWQIGVPMGVATLVLVGLMVLIISAETAYLRSPLADVSLIFVLMPVLAVGLVVLAVVGGLIYGVMYGLRELPFLFKRVQDIVFLVRDYTKDYTGRAARVVIEAEAKVASAQTVAEKLRLLPGGKDGRK